MCQQLGRFWREADIKRQAGPAGLVANDPTETSRLRLAGTIRFSLLGRRHTDGTSVRRSIPFWTQIRLRLNQHRC